MSDTLHQFFVARATFNSVPSAVAGGHYSSGDIGGRWVMTTRYRGWYWIATWSELPNACRELRWIRLDTQDWTNFPFAQILKT